MALIRPTVINARPGIIIPVIGGFAGTVLLTAGMFLAPLVGFPFIDIPHLMGGIFAADPTVALWLGFWMHFLAGAILFPILYGLIWPLLPGAMTGMVGDVMKGLSCGLGLWVLSGLLLPVAGLLNRLAPGVAQHPGFFALAFGWKGAAALLAGHIVYGLAIGLTSYMAADIFPLETIGWKGYIKAELPPGGTLYQEDFPEHPSLGAR
jgi:hypothetical protein